MILAGSGPYPTVVLPQIVAALITLSATTVLHIPRLQRTLPSFPAHRSHILPCPSIPRRPSLGFSPPSSVLPQTLPNALRPGLEAASAKSGPVEAPAISRYPLRNRTPSLQRPFPLRNPKGRSRSICVRDTGDDNLTTSEHSMRSILSSTPGICVRDPGGDMGSDKLTASEHSMRSILSSQPGICVRDTGGETGSGASEHSMRIRPPQTPQPGYAELETQLANYLVLFFRSCC
ncbi:hypothetical protein EDB89DRAFT_2069818 [Lactarius sanguifluus]|nr:hypothetical protein EDB89DRAFT_2069818 [Lactarius sanguifluus]